MNQKVLSMPDYVEGDALYYPYAYFSRTQSKI